jgi:hypothetical protein
MYRIIRAFFLAATVIGLLSLGSAFADETSGVFAGGKVNGGTVTFTKGGTQRMLKLSDDFQNTIDTPDPHWQVVDSKGNVYLLQKYMIKDDKTNREIMVPKYVPDIAKVQFWCAFAETMLGEASFKKPVK